MKNQTTKYPLYRKYKNNKSYFKIISPEKFQEIQVMGTKFYVFDFEAKILPDRNLINDLSFDYQDFCDVITKEEYDEILFKTK
ncbi:MAG TPA: hypothetical protein VKZ45_03160 [Vicingaceae bacterium]|nr:hypothetical protein [Vicingaceae bacterium]